jgi:hypothetical protein
MEPVARDTGRMEYTQLILFGLDADSWDGEGSIKPSALSESFIYFLDSEVNGRKGSPDEDW